MKKEYIILLCLGQFQYTHASTPSFIEFDDAFIQNTTEKINVSKFSYGNFIDKGEYKLDIYVNGKNKGTGSVFIKNESPNSDVTKQLCITSNLIELFDLKKTISLSKGCDELSKITSYGSAEINLSISRLNIFLPQAIVKNRPNDYISPALWDEGIPAGFISYNYNSYNYNNHNDKNRSQFLSLNNGVNLFGWNFRHGGNYTKSSYGHGKYTSYNTYAKHDIDTIEGQLTVGDFITKNNFMTNYSVRGIQVASEKQMVPQSQRGFFPEIKGVANTNARIQIKQKNNIIYEKVVPPGPFNINDLYSTPYNGDLEVSVLESDGSINKFIVPYASSSNMLRPGNNEYQFSFGRYRNTGFDSDYITNASYQYGLNNILTINSGSIFSQKYKSGILGGGVNLPIGSLYVDINYAMAQIDNNKNGYSLHGDYSVTLDKTNTYLSFAAFRFSSENYFDLDEAMNYKKHNKYYISNRTGAKSQYLISLNQSFPHDFGKIYFNAYQYDYWNSDKKIRYIQLNYNNNYKFITYSLGVNSSFHNENTNYNDAQVFASFSIPLNFMKNPPRLYTTVNSSNHNSSNTSTISGSDGENNEFNYSLSNSNRKGFDSNYSVSTSYRAPIANLSSSLSTDDHGDSQNSIGVSGGIVIHPYGITLANALGDSFAVIHANKGAGAKVNNSSNNSLDWWGNGIYNYLTPYEFNEVGVNIKDVSTDVQFHSTQKRVVPRKNSILLVNLETEYGPATLINLTRLNGEPVPMGASVLFNKQIVGMVGQDGQVFLRNISDNSTLKVDWGDKYCNFTYDSHRVAERNIAGFYILNEICEG